MLEYRVRSNGCFFTCAYTRNKHRPWPLAGGREGSPNYAEVIRARTGRVGDYAVVTALEVNEDDVIRIHTGNGGGYGDPLSRRASSFSMTCATTRSARSRRGTCTGFAIAGAPRSGVESLDPCRATPTASPGAHVSRGGRT